MLAYFLLVPLLLAPPRPISAGPPESGQKLFSIYCARCHGKDGRLGLNGAHDLTKSNLNVIGRTYLVTNGMGKMPAFKSELTPAEVQRVVEYSLTLK
ncbi:cytochrome c [Hymenobacter sp. RP-2-7]|uniref:Cytochrome c n=1 Tax=Hymenobacter polaris TaxID=2682546 RepID=A0A7Y0AEI5_9BACT|nr:cytochrome c [Hymenobacter polaris]NML65717.1 cytochrome c [Hymenobacter polaris]